MKKFIIGAALALATALPTAAPVAAGPTQDVLCHSEAQTFSHWFYQQFYC